MTKQRSGLSSALTVAVSLVVMAVAVIAVVLVARTRAGSVQGVRTSATPAAPLQAGAPSESFKVVGPRPAPIVYRPPGLSTATPVPLVVSFYGATGTPQHMEGLTKFEEVANRHGFVVLYPGSQTNPPWHGADDTTYLRNLIRHVMRTQNVDPRRVYLSGFSAGGREAYFLTCQISSMVAAVGVVSTTMRDYPCPLAHPISAVALYAASEATPSDLTMPSAADVAARWRAFDRCPSATAARTQAGPVAQQTWASCARGTAVASWVLAGGHHTWPGTYGLAPSDPDAQFNASEALWAFFAAHPTRG